VLTFFGGKNEAHCNSHPIVSFSLFPLRIQAQSTDVPQSDYSLKLQKLQDEINQLELQNEKIQSQTSVGSKPTLSLDGGSLEQDFESNSNSWTILQGQTPQFEVFSQSHT